MALLDFLKYINGVETIISRFFRNLKDPIRKFRIIKDLNEHYLKTRFFNGFDKLSMLDISHLIVQSLTVIHMNY
jgi:hypothetical protein